METGRSAELDVLLMACRDESRADTREQLVQFLEQHTLNWDRLYTLANRHRVAPFLYRALQPLPSIPQKLLTDLQSDCRTIATDNLLKLHHYREVDQLLTSQGIRHIPLKGVYLAANWYPDKGLRQIGDLDILVRKEDALAAIHLLESQGYQPNQKHTRYQQHDEQSMLLDLHEISLFKPFFNGSHFDIDLHWGVLLLNKDYKLFTLNEIESQPGLSIEWQIVLLVTHHGGTNIWQLIYFINDLYFLLKDKSIDWAWLMAKLRQYGLETIFLVGLHWCQQIRDLPLPATIQALLLVDRVQRLAAAYEKNWEAAETVAFSKLVMEQVWFFGKAQSQPGKPLKMGLTFFSSRIFRASTFRVGGHLLYIPKELGFITVFVRALRSLSRFLPTHR